MSALPPKADITETLFISAKCHKRAKRGFRSRGQLCLEERGAVVLAITFLLVVLCSDEARN